jgi:alpha-ketoglutarate-dependent taurine dioxygenase
MIATKLLKAEGLLPLVIEPEGGALENSALSALHSWLRDSRNLFESWLHRHGGLLFRGFSIDTGADFEALARVIEPELSDYIGGDSPRMKVSGKVYTSTEFPENYRISPHNELSYAARWPRKIFFYCDVPPRQGGETPIVDCREVLDAIEPEIRERFISRKVRYVNNLHGGYGIGRSWQATFETEDKEQISAYLSANGVDFHWSNDDALRITQINEAVLRHPQTGEQVWFNQAEQWHPSNIDEKTREALKALGFEDEELPHYASFGDGSPLDPSELEQIRTLMRERSMSFRWEKGDFLVLDNLLVAHGRNPFLGPRRILVAMA